MLFCFVFCFIGHKVVCRRWKNSAGAGAWIRMNYFSSEIQSFSILLRSCPWLGVCFYKWICSFSALCERQPDKNIPCQLREERRTAVQMRQTPSLSSPPHPLSLSLTALVLLFSWLRLLCSRLTSIHQLHAPLTPWPPSILRFPYSVSKCVCVCVCVCVCERERERDCASGFCALRHHHGYIMRRNRGRQRKERNT